MTNPYGDVRPGRRRYEIVNGGAGLFRYTVYRYYGDQQYPYGTIVGITMTRRAAEALARRDAKRADKQVVKTLFI